MDFFSDLEKIPFKIPKILFCRYLDTKISGTTPYRIVVDYELEYNLRVERTMTIDGNTFTVPKGAHIIRKPGQQACSSGDLNCYDIRLDFSWHSTTTNEMNSPSIKIQEKYDSYLWSVIPPIFVPRHQEDIHRIYKRLTTLTSPTQNNNIVASLLLTSLFHILVADAITEKLEDNYLKPTLMEEIRSYIRTNYYNDITLEHLADIANLNKNYFARRFKHEIGVAPIEYLIDIRIKTARDMLIFEGNSIKQIAYDCGFKNPSYFNRVFRKYFGLTPGEYRDAFNISQTELKKHL